MLELEDQRSVANVCKESLLL